MGPLEERMKLVIRASKEAHEIASQTLPELKQTLPKEEYEVMIYVVVSIHGKLLVTPVKHYLFPLLSLSCLYVICLFLLTFLVAVLRVFLCQIRAAEIQALVCPNTGAQDRIHNFRQILTWLTHTLRSLYRRKSVLELRFTDTMARLQWISTESALLERTQFHLTERHTMLQGKEDSELATDWLRRHTEFSDNLQGGLDSQQETIMSYEIEKLKKDEMASIQFDNLMQELFEALNADNRLIAERVRHKNLPSPSTPSTHYSNHPLTPTPSPHPINRLHWK